MRSPEVPRPGRGRLLWQVLASLGKGSVVFPTTLRREGLLGPFGVEFQREGIGAGLLLRHAGRIVLRGVHTMLDGGPERSQAKGGVSR